MQIVMLRIALAFLATLICVPGRAESVPTFTAATSCTVLARALRAEDMAVLLASRDFIFNVMDQRDAELAAKGQPRMMAALNRDGRALMFAMTGTYCENNPRRTIHAMAVEVYDGARAMQRDMGTLR